MRSLVPLDRLELPSNDYKSLVLAFILKGHFMENSARFELAYGGVAVHCVNQFRQEFIIGSYPNI